jgi:hypothetical protein
MKNKISKDSKIYQELKNLWNNFDPIGVYTEDADWPDDEYESYIIPTLELLENNATFDQLYNYIHSLVTTHMGMEQIKNEYITHFVQILQKWYSLKN